MTGGGTVYSRINLTFFLPFCRPHHRWCQRTRPALSKRPRALSVVRCVEGPSETKEQPEPDERVERGIRLYRNVHNSASEVNVWGQALLHRLESRELALASWWVTPCRGLRVGYTEARGFGGVLGLLTSVWC